jgi:L-amino acid N-acyltransferase YncA
MPPAELSADLNIETHAYPLSPTVQTELVRLLRTEWTHTDYNWVEAMHGDYSEALVIASVIIRCRGTAVSTATIHFARDRPQTAVLGSVLTHPNHRRRGFGGHSIELALSLAEDAGCQVCLLGTAMKPRNIYQRHGFVWQNGAIMRRAFGTGAFEADYFAPHQPAAIRAANWGDLPGLTLLLAQPLAIACVDYLRGLMSPRHATAERCLSNFPVLWYDTAARNGMLAMLAEPDTGRIFGFGSVTRSPGPARRHTASLDFAAHENYESSMPALLAHLLDGCRSHGIQRAHVCIADGDTSKLACLRQHGFREAARLPGALHLGDGLRDVLVLEKPL